MADSTAAGKGLLAFIHTDEGLARYREAALGLVSLGLVLLSNRLGFDVPEHLAEWSHLTTTQVSVVLTFIVAQVLYWLSQFNNKVDSIVHVGAAADVFFSREETEFDQAPVMELDVDAES